MKIISLDISYRKPIAAACLSARGRLLWTGLVSPQRDIYTTVNAILEQVIRIGPKTLVVVETPLMIKNMNTAYVMARMHGMLEKGIRDGGLLFFGVHPRSWQSKMLKDASKSADLKRASMLAATEFLGREPDNHDIADAINLARYTHINRQAILASIRGSEKFSER